VRYLNQLAVVHEVPGAARTTKRKRFVLRNRDEWIGIKVPAIVSQELFDKVQERLRVVKSRYCKLSQTALLTGYVRCADCGRNFGHGYMQSRYRLRTGGTATHDEASTDAASAKATASTTSQIEAAAAILPSPLPC
jgi:hypothetical protein